MKIKYALAAVFAASFINAHAAMDHSAHRGGGGRSDMGGAACVRPQFSKMLPAHLATVAPGAEFSFVVSNLVDPDDLSVEVKRQPVKVEAEYKDPYFVIKGKIPDVLRNTAARIDIKVDSKVPTCRAEDGWLIKISEN